MYDSFTRIEGTIFSIIIMGIIGYILTWIVLNKKTYDVIEGILYKLRRK